jgi:hypothetical protein
MFGNQDDNGNTQAGLKLVSNFYFSFFFGLALVSAHPSSTPFLQTTIMAAVHFDLAAFPTTETIKMLTNILVKITRTNDRLCNTTSSPDLEKDRPNPHAPIYTCFHARSIPTIDIHSYLSRILKYTPCANEVCFVIYAVSRRP